VCRARSTTLRLSWPQLPKSTAARIQEGKEEIQKKKDKKKINYKLQIHSRHYFVGLRVDWPVATLIFLGLFHWDEWKIRLDDDRSIGLLLCGAGASSRPSKKGGRRKGKRFY
jgi:hypothetical protein